MKRFLPGIILFVSVFLSGWVAVYLLADAYLNRLTKDTSGIVFIWGDSQTCQGIDYGMLQKLTRKEIYSAAHHGAGVYDLLVFSKKIPDQSTVVIELSKPAQIRAKSTDYNRTGMSFYALLQLYKNGYDFNEIWKVFRNNKIPRRLFSSPNSLYNNAETAVISDEVTRFARFYASNPGFLEDKQSLYYLAFKNLAEKNCRLIIVDFPYHPLLTEIESKSVLKQKTDIFEKKICSLVNTGPGDTLFFPQHINVMYDLTHLNQRGAELLTSFLGDALNSGKGPMFLRCVVKPAE